MKVIHFQRKPVSERYFSIENYFEAIRKELPSFGVEAKKVVCPYISQGLFKRIYNAVQATFYRADIYHVTGDVHYLTLFLPKKRTVLTIHDCVFMNHPSKWARKVLKLFWLTLPAKRVSHITCVSEKTKEEVLRFIQFPPQRILVIPTVADRFLFTSSDFSFRLRPSILHIGTTPNKNLDRVAQALEGIPCQLEIVGPLSEEQILVLERHHIQYHQEVGISNERMAEKYQEADLVLFASIYEGFGMPILEAQLSGRPVITSHLAPMCEIAGEGACLVDPFDPQSIRNGVLKMIQDEEYRKESIQKGAKNVERFSPHKVAGDYASLYQQMVGNTP